MQQHYYLYKTTNNINGKFYIGVHATKNLDDGYLGSGVLLNRAIKKYGVEHFSKEILKFFESEKEMYEMEKEIVNQDLVENKDNYNITCGGHGGFSHIFQKGSHIHGRGGLKGEAHQFYGKTRPNFSGENHPFWGKKRPEFSEWMKENSPTKGTIRPQSVKDAVSKANKGRKHSAEVNKKKGRSGELHPFYGKKINLGKRWITDGVNSKRVDLEKFNLTYPWVLGKTTSYKKRVLQIDKKTGEIIAEYASLKEAGESSGTSRSSISSCCSGKLESAKGFIWKFK